MVLCEWQMCVPAARANGALCVSARMLAPHLRGLVPNGPGPGGWGPHLNISFSIQQSYSDELNITILGNLNKAPCKCHSDFCTY